MNGFDKEDVMDKYVKENKFTFPVVVANTGGGGGGEYALAKAYGVEAYPTNYLVDAKGTVVFRSVGFDEAGLRSAIEKLIK